MMETFFDLLPYVAVFYVAFKLGKNWALFQLGQSIADRPDDMIRVLNQIKQLEQESREISVERVGDQVYAYAKDTGEFLAQAPDPAGLAEVIRQRFPNEKFFGTIDPDHPAKPLAE